MIVKGNKIVSIIKTITNAINKAIKTINNSLISFIILNIIKKTTKAQFLEFDVLYDIL